MSLPRVGDTLDIQVEDISTTLVVILAVDLDEAIWTILDRTDGLVKMMMFDENNNWFWVEPTEQALG